MELIKSFFTSRTDSQVFEPVRDKSPVRNIQEQDQEVAVSLFRRLIAQYYPNATDFEMETLKGPRCKFKDMVRYFEANISSYGYWTHPTAERIEQELLRALPKLIQKDEKGAFKDLENVLGKLAGLGVSEAQIPKMLQKFHNNSKSFTETNPQVAHQLLNYKTARAVYDTVINQWALGFFQAHPSKSEGLSLAGRVLPVEQPGLIDRALHFIFGYKTEAFRRLESRQTHFLNRYEKITEGLEKLPHLEVQFCAAFNRLANDYSLSVKVHSLVELQQWLEGPLDPRILPLDLRETFMHDYIEKANEVMGFFNHPTSLLQKIELYPQYRSFYVEAFDQLREGFGLSTLSSTEEWFRNPPSPKELPLSNRAALMFRFHEEVMRIIEAGTKSTRISIPVEHQVVAVSLFKDLADRYSPGLSETIHSIADVQKWLVAGPPKTGLKRGERWARVAIILEFSKGVDHMKHGESFVVRKGSEHTQAKVHWPENQPIGSIQFLPPLTKEARLERQAPMYENRTDRPFRPYNTPGNIEADRVWKDEGPQIFTHQRLQDISKQIQFFDRDMQNYAIHRLNNCAQTHFGKTFTPLHSLEDTLAFLSGNLDTKASKQAKAFVLEFHDILQEITSIQEKLNEASF